MITRLHNHTTTKWWSFKTPPKGKSTIPNITYTFNTCVITQGCTRASVHASQHARKQAPRPICTHAYMYDNASSTHACSSAHMHVHSRIGQSPNKRPCASEQSFHCELPVSLENETGKTALTKNAHGESSCWQRQCASEMPSGEDRKFQNSRIQTTIEATSESMLSGWADWDHCKKPYLVLLPELTSRIKTKHIHMWILTHVTMTHVEIVICNTMIVVSLKTCCQQ